MENGHTKNAALITSLAFHYQVLIGLEQCFKMQDGQSVWFERDGDVSLVGNSADDSKQIEVKKYADALTDHHENLWKTLKNWLAAEFKQENYSSLVLHTTQPFGAKSTLNDWKQKNTVERLQILKDIFSTRTQEELTADTPKPIVQMQKSVMATETEKLKAVLAKVVLFTEADDEQTLRDKILAHPVGIPGSNKDRYLQGLIGFVYYSANSEKWEIKKSDFEAKCEDLTATYCRKEFTFPPFKGHEATKEEIKQHEELLFVKKITDIDHHEVIPDALGNWLELQNSLNEQLDEYPLFRDKTVEYQKKLIKNFKLNYSTAQLKCTSPICDSKIFYNQTIIEPPLYMGSVPPPPEYKNGLIHDAMDDAKQNLRWRVEP
ncbi:MAG: hypothetical protein ACYDHC_02855 [Desulfuromonadaceae bacterium]